MPTNKGRLKDLNNIIIIWNGHERNARVSEGNGNRNWGYFVEKNSVELLNVRVRDSSEKPTDK